MSCITKLYSPNNGSKKFQPIIISDPPLLPGKTRVKAIQHCFFGIPFSFPQPISTSSPHMPFALFGHFLVGFQGTCLDRRVSAGSEDLSLVFGTVVVFYGLTRLLEGLRAFLVTSTDKFYLTTGH